MRRYPHPRRERSFVKAGQTLGAQYLDEPVSDSFVHGTLPGRVRLLIVQPRRQDVERLHGGGYASTSYRGGQEVLGISNRGFTSMLHVYLLILCQIVEIF